MNEVLAAAYRSSMLLLAIMAGSMSMGQGKFTVNGRLKVDGADMTGARAVVYKDGVKERTITSGLSKFTLDLGLNANYVISFEREGFVSKKISFNTQVPADAVANGFTPFDFAVSLFKQYDDINIVVFNQPVGVIRYEPSAGDFDYDTDYTKSIQSQLQDVVAQVEKKQKEEERATEAATKQQADAERAQAKAKAEEEKQAAAQQVAAAKAAAEAQRKAQADVRAEEERKAALAREESKRKPVEPRTEAAKPPPPAPYLPVKERKPPPPTPAPVRNSLASQPNQGQDARRTAEPVLVEEASPVHKAPAVAETEERPIAELEEPVTNRTEDLLVEGNKVTTIVRLETDGVTTEFRRVYHKWGGTFFFKNGAVCSQQQYEKEALQPQLAGASPRGKLD